jgi:thiamine kinase-like enzyme
MHFVGTIADRLERFSVESGYGNVATELLPATDRGLLNVEIMTREIRQRLRKSLRRGSQATDVVIAIKRNARLIFPDPSREGRLITAKIGLPSKKRDVSLSREIKARKLLARWGKVPTPKLLRYDNKRLSWFAEEYVTENKTICDFDKLKLFLAHYAVRLYAPAARSRPVSVLLRRFQISMSQLLDVLREAGTEIPGGNGEFTWPVSLLHGDLGASNIIADQDDLLFLVDWETSRPGPVAWDLIKLFHGQPDLVHNILRALSRRSDISPANQIHVVSAVKLIGRHRSHIINCAIDGLLAKGISLHDAPRKIAYAKIREFARQELGADTQTGYPDWLVEQRLDADARKRGSNQSATCCNG